MPAHAFSSPQDGGRAVSASPSGRNAAVVDAAPRPVSSASPTATTSAGTPTVETGGADTVDYSRWEATDILEALLRMSSCEKSGRRSEGQATEAADLTTGRRSTPLESNVSPPKALRQPGRAPHAAILRPKHDEELAGARALPANAPDPLPPAASAAQGGGSPSSIASSSPPPAPPFRETATIAPQNQTPTQRRVTAAHNDNAQRRDNHDVQRRACTFTGSTAGVDSTGLVFSNLNSRSATTAASCLSPQEDGFLAETSLRRTLYASLNETAPTGAKGASEAAAAPQSSTVHTEVDGALWQQAFATHAQRLLRETQQQVEELRRCQRKTAQEAQRANALAAAYRALEVQLAEADARRAEERAAHEDAVTTLSQQVLRLEEGVGRLRRTKVELQRQLEGSRAAAAQQQQAHERELRELRSALEKEVRRARSEQPQQTSQWRGEHQFLEEKQAEWASLRVAGAALQMQLEAGGAPPECSHKHSKAVSLHAVSLPSGETGGEGSAAVIRVDVATNTDDVHLPATVAPPQEDPASPYTRVHPDVLAQQQLREQTILSQLSIADARLQHESRQRRLAEGRVAELLDQVEQLRGALASAETAAQNAERMCETARQAPVVGPGLETAATNKDSANRGTPQQRGAISETGDERQPEPQLLREIQHEYRELRRESAALLARHNAQQRREAERWIAVRSAVSALLHLVGLPNAQGPLEAAVATDSLDLDGLGGPLREACEASLHAVLTALETVAATLRSQQEAAAEATLQEQRKLSTLEKAVREAEAQKRAHMATLKAAEAQLLESRRELAACQKRERRREDRQAAHSAMWRSAEMQLKQVVNVVRRALREYARPLSASWVRPTATGNAVGDGPESAGGRVSRRGTCTPKSPSRRSPTPAESRNDAEENEGDASMAHPTADAALVWASDRDAITAALEVMLHPHGFVPQRVAFEADEEEEAEAVAASTDPSPSRPPSSPAAHSARLPMSAPVATELTGAGGDSAESDVCRDVAVIARGLLKLLARWRKRQHTLVESLKGLQRLVADMMAKSIALEDSQRETEAHYQQQLRLSRTAEQRRAHQLEQMQHELDDAKRQREIDSAQVRHQAGEWESERDVLRRRICVAEEKLSRTEQALVETDVNRSVQHASHEALQHALSDVTAARDRLERRQADLCVHIEDLEARLLVANQTQTGLHALITIAVAFIVRLLADYQQLQGHYQILRALAWTDAQTMSVVARVLERNCPRGSDPATAVTGEQGPRWPTEAAGGASPWLADAWPPSAAPATRLRAAVYAVRAVMRISRLLAARQRLRGNAGARHRDGAPLTSAAAAVQPAAWQPLLLALTSAITWGAATPGLTSVVALPHHSLLQRYTTRSDACILPVVRLPPPLELAAVAHDEGEVGGRGRGHRGCFDCSGGANENGTAGIGADHPQRQLMQLLMISQIDVQDPVTRHLWAGVVAAASASGRATAELLRFAQARHALSEKLLMLPGHSTTTIPPTHPSLLALHLRPLLPDRLAAHLHLHLQRSAAQTRHAEESSQLLQRLAQENETLMAALKQRTHEYDAASTELQSLTSQLHRQQAERAERMAVQEKLVETRASLLQERKRRREAEERVAALQQARLQWLGDQEQYKREVYVLNMELANISVGGAPPSGGRTGALSLPPRVGAGPALTKSEWSIHVDDTTMTDVVCSSSSPPTHFDPPSSSSRNGSALHRHQCAGDSHPLPVSCTAPLAAEVEWRPSPELAYHYEQLQSGHPCSRHSHTRHPHDGSSDMETKARKASDGHGETSPFPAQQCRSRTKLPTPEQLTQSALPGGACSAAGSSGREGVAQTVSDTGASLWNAHLQCQAASGTATPSMTVASMATRVTAAGAEPPPLPQPLALYIPSVTRQRELAGSDTAERLADHGPGIAAITTAKTNSAKRVTSLNKDGLNIVGRRAKTAASPSSFPADAPVSDMDVCAATPPPLAALPPRLSHATLSLPPPLTLGAVAAGEGPQQLRLSPSYSAEPPRAPTATPASPSSAFTRLPAPRPPPPRPSSHHASSSEAHETHALEPALSREEAASLLRPTASASRPSRDGGFEAAREVVVEASRATYHVSGSLYYTAR
ncbi:hypothetical protein LSCM1_07179 [Leishmania martiniquensis]|uniref:Uncharacterized protein n=1 Tax=Leishmania martiniquensis TaxID=1580590 RepID=A0A836KU50_9TRYP|nr:hypothetical protein LSCM1_07179 [Leishmania martiniquensis]